MSINPDRASDFDEAGLGIRDSDGNQLFYFTTLSGDPSGFAAPINSWIFRSDNLTIWYKFGAGDNDWRQIRANDIAFDVSTLTTNSPDLSGLTQSFEVMSALANRHFGKEFNYQQAASFSTGLGTFQTALQISQVAPAGTYRAAYSFTVTNSKANTNSETEFRFNGTRDFLRTQTATNVNAISGIKGDLVHAGGTLTIDIRTQVIAGNGTADLTNIKLELWRVL